MNRSISNLLSPFWSNYLNDSTCRMAATLSLHGEQHISWSKWPTRQAHYYKSNLNELNVIILLCVMNSDVFTRPLFSTGIIVSAWSQQPGFHWFFLSIFFFFENSEGLVEAEIILDKMLPFTFCWPCCLYPISLTVSQPCLGICLKLSQLFLWCGFFLSCCFTIPAWWSPHYGSLHRCRLPIYTGFIGQKQIWLCRSNVSRLPARSWFKQRTTEAALSAVYFYFAGQTLWPQRRSDCSVFTKASNIYFEKLSHS